MDNFWKWMHKNKLPCNFLEHEIYIGCMMRYLDEKSEKEWIGTLAWVGDAMIGFEYCKRTERRFQWLESKINELEAKR